MPGGGAARTAVCAHASLGGARRTVPTRDPRMPATSSAWLSASLRRSCWNDRKNRKRREGVHRIVSLAVLGMTVKILFAESTTGQRPLAQMVPILDLSGTIRA